MRSVPAMPHPAEMRDLSTACRQKQTSTRSFFQQNVGQLGNHAQQENFIQTAGAMLCNISGMRNATVLQDLAQRLLVPSKLRNDCTEGRGEGVKMTQVPRIRRQRTRCQGLIRRLFFRISGRAGETRTSTISKREPPISAVGVSAGTAPSPPRAKQLHNIGQKQSDARCEAQSRRVEVAARLGRR